MNEPKLRAKENRNGKYSLYVDIYHKGKRVKHYLNIIVHADYTKETKPRIEKKDIEAWKEAKKKYISISNDLVNNNSSIEAITNKDKDFISYFQKKMKDKNNNSYNGAIYQLKAFAGEKLTFKEVSYTWITGFKKFLLGRVSANTCHTYLRRLIVVWNEAKREKITNYNPFEEVALPKLWQPDRNHLDHDEMKALWNTPVTCQYQIKEAFIFACSTGLRKSDIYRLTWNQITEDSISIRPKKTPEKIIYIPLSDDSKVILKSLPREGERVFCNLPNEAHFNQYLKIWGKDAGITKRMHSHLGRHSFATEIYSQTDDIRVTQSILGHAKIEQTLIYAKDKEEHKQAAINKMRSVTSDKVT
jgi:integrase